MRKKAGILTVTVFTLLCMLSIWPFALVRKDVTYESQATEYLYTNADQKISTQMEQTFAARESILRGVAFAVDFTGDNCNVIFRLKDEAGKVLAEQTVSLDAEYVDRYYWINMNARLKKGLEYSWCVEIQNAEQVNGGFLYSTKQETDTAGNDELRVDGEYYEGQAVSSYIYGEPLNIVNTICLWAFILMIGITLLGMIIPIEECDLLKKTEQLLEKYRNVILTAEIIVVTALVIRSCFTQAVDWDEAYTWDIVKNNSFFGVIKAQSIDNHPPLYFLLVKIAAILFGDKIMVYKLVSVAGMLASMILCATLLKKRWGVMAAVPTILVLGLAPNFIFYNINVRMYSWMTFFVLAAALLAYEIVLDGGKEQRNWIGLAIVTLGAIYTQYFAVVPLLFIYVYLLCECRRNKNIRKLIICCAAIVVLYLPQLYLIVKMLQRDSSTFDEGLKASLNLNELLIWSFDTNIKWSSYIPTVAYILALLLFILSWRKIERHRRNFLTITMAIYPLTWLICWGISQKMNHFWHNRYMLDALLFAWLFIALIYSARGVPTWLCVCIWLGIICLSSYGITYSKEMLTVPYIQDARQKLAEIPDGVDVIYNYDTYDTIYKYYLPGNYFLWYEDVDFSKMEGDSIYMISWGGGGFPQEVIDTYNITIEYLSFFQLEKGIGDVALCKVHFKN